MAEGSDLKFGQINIQNGWRTFLLVMCMFVCLVITDTEGTGSTSGIPRFLTEPQSSIVRVGSTVSLSCSAEPDSAVITWILDGTAIKSTPSSGSRRISRSLAPTGGYEIRGGSLRIESFGPEYEGDYQCLATNQAGGVLTAEAKVQAAALGTFEVSPSYKDIVTLEGNVGVVPCPVPPSVPPAVIEFELNGTKITPSDRYIMLPSGSLQISNISVTDRGLYKCSALNPITGSRIPSFTTQKLSVIESNKSATSTCAGDLDAVWMTLSKPFLSQCSFKNQHAFRSKEGVVKPTVTWKPPTSVTLVQGKELTLECAAEGIPPPRVTWEKYGGHLPVERFSQVLGNLIIHDVQKFDAGTYLCKVTPATGGSSGVLTNVVSVEVIETPIIETPPVEQNASEGSTIVFKCRSQAASRANIEWRFNGNKVISEQFIDVRDSTLTLSNVRRKQAGAYQCIARNAAGSAYAAARLSVYDPLKGRNVETRDYDEYGDEIEESAADKQRKPAGRENTYDLVAPSRPEISQKLESSVKVHWSMPMTLGSGSGPKLTGFRVQYRELNERLGDWVTVPDEILPTQRHYEIQRLRPGASYRFRLVALYSNHETRTSRNSSKVTLESGSQSRGASLPSPVIVEARPLSVSEIIIGWQQHETDGWPVDGFHIYYSPYSEEMSYQKHTVIGSTVRHAVLSHLLPGTSYSIKLQSYSTAARAESQYSNTVVKQTLGHIGDTPPDSGVAEYPHVSSRGERPGGPGGPGSGQSPQRAGEGEKGLPATSPNNSQMLYIIIGVVLGAVVLVVAACAAACFWKQRLAKRFDNGKSKKCSNSKMSEQSEHFLDSTVMMKPCMEYSDHGPLGKASSYQLKVNGSHLPGCGGKCSTSVVHGNGACLITAGEGPPIRMGTKTGLAELTLPPPPHPSSLHLSHSSPSYTSPTENLPGQKILPSPIYTKLPDMDESRSSSASDQRNQRCYPGALPGRQGPVPSRPSPDHIPRSNEHQLQLFNQQQQQLQQPYYMIDPSRRTAGSGSGGSSGAESKIAHRLSADERQGMKGKSVPLQRYLAGSSVNACGGNDEETLSELYGAGQGRRASSHDSLDSASLGGGDTSLAPGSCTSLEAPSDVFAPVAFSNRYPQNNVMDTGHHTASVSRPSAYINPADYQCKTGIPRDSDWMSHQGAGFGLGGDYRDRSRENGTTSLLARRANDYPTDFR